MSDEIKNTPTDPNQPEIPEQAKEPETPTTRVREKLQKEEEKIIEYKKDVRFLWIYASVFCAVLLILIGASYFIQQKIHAEVDEYKTTAENAEITSSQNQSRLQNISDENKYLKEQNKLLEKENQTLQAMISTDAELLNAGDKIILQMQKLLEVSNLYQQGETEQAATVLGTIDSTLLPESSQEIYTYYQGLLEVK